MPENGTWPKRRKPKPPAIEVLKDKEGNLVDDAPEVNDLVADYFEDLYKIPKDDPPEVLPDWVLAPPCADDSIGLDLDLEQLVETVRNIVQPLQG